MVVKVYVRPAMDTATELTSDAPRETSVHAGYGSLVRTAYRLAAQMQPHSALPPHQRTWWLTGNEAKIETQMISVKKSVIKDNIKNDKVGQQDQLYLNRQKHEIWDTYRKVYCASARVTRYTRTKAPYCLKVIEQLSICADSL